MRTRIFHFLFLIFFFTSQIFAQNAVLEQTVRGKVTDTETRFPLIGAQVILITESGQKLGAMTDDQGDYRFARVPVGRHTFTYSYLGYLPMTFNNIEVTSGKEVILDAAMQVSSLTVDAVEISAQRDGEAGNEMAVVSAREFSVTETNLYAGSRGEPARMASNYAGVQGADDSRNDIVIRGNSPQGLIYRMDGVNLPNPNHFAIAGTSGGPVTILNNKYLSNSDFFTGAFPAEFGNAIAGVFDLRMRNGNNEKYEFSGQLGFLGTELTAEGPLSKKSKASFLVNYRYSTLQLFSFLGVNIGTDAVPQYQDGAFRLNFPLKNGANLAIWGIGGASTIDIVLSDQPKPDSATLIFGSNDRDQYFTTRTGVLAATYTHPISLNTFVKAGLSVSHQDVVTVHDQIFRRVVGDAFVVDSLPNILQYTFAETRYGTYAYVNHRIGRKHTFKAGLYLDYLDMFYLDSARAVRPQPGGAAALLDPWRVRWDANQGAFIFQPYVQYRLRLQDRFTLSAGLSSLYFSLNNNSFSPVEPRIGASYQLNEKSRLSFGAGLHSQIQSPYLYFYGMTSEGRDPQEHNLNMGLTKSIHYVLSFDQMVGKDIRIKAEAYFQQLYNIPVEDRISSFSLVNTGSGFSRFFPDTLVNEGTGRNLGAELTVEKFFTRGYYFLLTGSVFDAKYKGSDGVLRNTTFNGRYAFNALFAKEFTIKDKNAFQLSGKLTYAGGRWYGPVDTAASSQALEIIYASETQNSLQFRPYFRADLRMAYRWNLKSVTHEVAFDLVNIFNVKNILTLTYSPDHPSGNPIQEEYQLGFLPLFYYKIDW